MPVEFDQDMSTLIRKFEIRRFTEQLQNDGQLVQNLLNKNFDSFSTLKNPEVAKYNFSILNNSPNHKQFWLG